MIEEIVAGLVALASLVVFIPILIIGLIGSLICKLGTNPISATLLVILAYFIFFR